MGNNQNSRKPKTLSSGRPPNSSHKPSHTLSSRSTRTTIREYHTLNKRLSRARAANDLPSILALESRLSSLGGLAAYQAASTQGQANERGGDTSIELIRWLAPFLLPANPSSSSSHSSSSRANSHLRLLEVGALSATNACTRARVFADIERIDLRAHGPGIRQQDFMQRPLPRQGTVGDGDRFDVLSLSLVLNFVPDARARGEMLRRTTEFLTRKVRGGAGGGGLGVGVDAKGEDGGEEENERDGSGKGEDAGREREVSGMLFLVLPAPCIVNSRYFDDGRLGEIMTSLGYVMRKRKQTAKLVYYLWQLAMEPTNQEVKKALVRDGKGMNNFCVELRNDN